MGGARGATIAPVDGATSPAALHGQIALATVLPLAVLVTVHALGGLPRWLAVVTLFMGAPHVLATIGLYLERDIRAVASADPVRFVVAPLTMVPIAVAIFVVAEGAVAVLAVTAFFVWQTQHYTKQNVGMFAFWCRSAGLAPMQPRERSLIGATTALGVLGILRAMELAPSLDGALRLGGVGLLAAGALVAVVPFRGARSAALGVAVAFYAPLFAFDVNLLAAAFAYQAAHGVQYYLMVGHVIRDNPVAVRVTIPVVLIGGVAPLALLTSSTFLAAPALFGLAKGLAAAHFVADASLWRLRDARIRAVMARRFSFL